MRILIKHGYLITLDRNKRVYERGDVLIQDDRIAAVGTLIEEIDAVPDRVMDAKNRLVFPGMVNACLVPQSGLWKGVFDHQAIQKILSGIEGAPNLAEDLSYWLALLAGIEMLHSGVTTVIHQSAKILQNSPLITQAADRAYKDLGIRAVMAENIPKSGKDIMVFNPLTSLVEGKPVLPIHKYQTGFLRLALGTGAFSGGNHNMFDVLKMAFAMQRILQPDYHKWPTVEQVLEMATENGARLYGLQGEIGSLVAGKKADLVFYNVRGFSFSPLNNPLDQFVCLEDGSSIDLVLVDGKVVFEQGKALLVDETMVMRQVNSLYTQIAHIRTNVEG